MASGMYDYGREMFLGGDIAFNSDVIGCALIDSDHVQALTTHQTFSQIDSDLVGAVVNLGSQTITDGTADAANVNFASVSGSQVDYVVLFKNTGTNTTSKLICCIDSDATGIPVTPNGGDINVNWNASGIFTL